MKTKIYYEVKDNTGWISDFYKANVEKAKQKIEELSEQDSFRNTVYFTINKIEININENEMIMHRKEIATYWKKRKKWYI